MSKNLKAYTLELLGSAPFTDKEVATALETSVTWVRMFKAGEIKSPNVDLIQRLYEFLTGKPLLG